MGTQTKGKIRLHYFYCVQSSSVFFIEALYGLGPSKIEKNLNVILRRKEQLHHRTSQGN